MSNHTVSWCDPLTGPHGCDPSNFNSFKIFYSVAFFSLTAAWLALIAKAVKRLYHQGLVWHSFAIPVNLLFILAGSLRVFHCVVQMAQFKQDDEVWEHFGFNATLVADYYNEKEWLSRGFMIWLSYAPIALILCGFFVLIVFWLDIWRVTKKFSKASPPAAYFLYPLPLSLIFIGVNLIPMLMAVCNNFDRDKYIVGFRIELSKYPLSRTGIATGTNSQSQLQKTTKQLNTLVALTGLKTFNIFAACGIYCADDHLVVFSFFTIIVFCAYLGLFLDFSKQEGERTLKTVVRRLKRVLFRIGIGCTFFCFGSLFAVGWWPVIVEEDDRQEWWMVIVGIQFVGEFFLMDAAASSIRDGDMTRKGLGRALAKKTRVSVRDLRGDKSIRVDSIKSNVSLSSTSTSASTSASSLKPVASGTSPAVQCEAAVPIFTKEELEFAEELPLWVKFPDSVSQFFSFPHPIDMINVRIKSLIMLMLISLSLLLDATLDIPWIYIYVTVGYLTRAACGPRLDPLSWITFYFLRPAVDYILKVKPSYTAGPPKRFAQVCGFIMALVYCLVRMVGDYKEVANYIAGFHLMLILLEFYFEICGGCAMFAMMMLCKLIPQDTCEQCKILFANDDDEKVFFSNSKSGTSKTPDAESS